MIIGNSKGFTLVEVMISFLLLAMCSMAILPAFLVVYNERLTLKQEEKVLHHLQELIQLYLADQPPIELDSWVKKEEFTDPATNVYLVCLSFVGENKRDYKRCLHAKR
ncbi:type II secretion system protein [Alkalihalophilus sp. As8PL]|uniref:Type II secretion system protein n=1 Tax=Alkalihalophilus sp. As8PL TaxID=3237103 RepID=A0AB39BRI6_9BACI